MSVLLEQLAEADEGAVAELAAAEIRRLPAGSSNGAEAFGGVSFLIVESGFVVIRRRLPRRLPGRRGVVMCHGGTGALLTVPELDETLDALVVADVTLVSEATYGNLLARPNVAIVLSDALRSALRQKRDAIANFASVRPVDRVERKLLQLAREHGRVVPDGIRLDFPITHELLAEMIGSARETVSRAIDRLESTGFVVREGRSYRLQVEPEALERW
jgi:CRP/FNR family transcriptional regulator, cyclic AMP receptor protein